MSEKRVKAILDALAKRYGSEAFVSDGYAYYDDALKAFTKLFKLRSSQTPPVYGPSGEIEESFAIEDRFKEWLKGAGRYAILWDAWKEAWAQALDYERNRETLPKSAPTRDEFRSLVTKMMSRMVRREWESERDREALMEAWTMVTECERMRIEIIERSYVTLTSSGESRSDWKTEANLEAAHDRIDELENEMNAYKDRSQKRIAELEAAADKALWLLDYGSVDDRKPEEVLREALAKKGQTHE